MCPWTAHFPYTFEAAIKDIPKQTYSVLETHKNQRQIVNLIFVSYDLGYLAQKCLPNHHDYPQFQLL